MLEGDAENDVILRKYFFAFYNIYLDPANNRLIWLIKPKASEEKRGTRTWLVYRKANLRKIKD